MKSIKLRFERDSASKQLLHKNRTSTDAIGAVVNWADPKLGRSYDKCKDEDEELEVIVEFSADDTKAIDELVTRCRKLGIDCFIIKNDNQFT